MPIIPPPVVPPIGYTVSDVINDALIEAGILSPGEEAMNNDADVFLWAFRKMNYLIDVWQSMRSKVFAYSFTLYTLQAGLQPHTIGPAAGATFSTGSAPRPVAIESAALILNTGGQIDLPINIRDKDWWATQQVKQIQTNVPTDLYYQPDNPNGSMFFWPVPNSANQVRLQTRNMLSLYSQPEDAIGGPGGPNSLPPTYRAALMLTLAESLLPGSKLAAHPVLVEAAKQARQAMGDNNFKSPRIQSMDFGMPHGGKKKSDFNWATGGPPYGPPQ